MDGLLEMPTAKPQDIESTRKYESHDKKYLGMWSDCHHPVLQAPQVWLAHGKDRATPLWTLP